jgi:hypothetical protein
VTDAAGEFRAVMGAILHRLSPPVSGPAKALLVFLGVHAVRLPSVTVLPGDPHPTLRLVWNTPGLFLDVEILANGRCEWFYANDAARHFEGTKEEPEASFPAAFLTRVREFSESPPHAE